MKLCFAGGAIILLLICSGAVSAKERTLIYDEDAFTYELTFDDSRVSLSQMREIACLSPWVSTYCAPFLIGIDAGNNGGTETIHKVFFAPSLEVCIAGPGRPCRRNPEVPDAAFLSNALLNLREGAKEVEILRERQVPSVLASIKASLLASLERSLEKQKARYEYLKSGDTAHMRQILCGVCVCGTPEETLLEQLRTVSDPRTRLKLAWYDWQNKLIACETARHPPPYPLDKWRQFLKEYDVAEKRRSNHVD
jgi:hypothetical protein